MGRGKGEGVGISGTESQLGCMTNGQDKTSFRSSKDHSCAIWGDSRLGRWERILTTLVQMSLEAPRTF